MSPIMADEIDKVNELKGTREDVLELMHGIMHAYRSAYHQRLLDGLHGVTHMDSRVLGYFSRHPGATLSDVSAHSGRDKAQLTRLIKGLRDKGLLQGEVSENDRRNVKLTLTPRGHGIHHALQQEHRRLEARAIADLSEPQLQQLVTLLQQISRNLATGDRPAG